MTLSFEFHLNSAKFSRSKVISFKTYCPDTPHTHTVPIGLRGWLKWSNGSCFVTGAATESSDGSVNPNIPLAEPPFTKQHQKKNSKFTELTELISLTVLQSQRFTAEPRPLRRMSPTPKSYMAFENWQSTDRTRKRSESAYICQVHDNVMMYTSTRLHKHLPP